MHRGSISQIRLPIENTSQRCCVSCGGKSRFQPTTKFRPMERVLLFLQSFSQMNLNAWGAEFLQWFLPVEFSTLDCHLCGLILLHEKRSVLIAYWVTGRTQGGKFSLIWFLDWVIPVADLWGGPGGCPQDFLLIMQFSGENPYFEQILGSGPPLRAKTPLGPLTKILDPRLDTSGTGQPSKQLGEKRTMAGFHSHWNPIWKYQIHLVRLWLWSM